MIENRLPWPASPEAPPEDAAAAIRREYEAWATEPADDEDDTLDGAVARSTVLLGIAAFLTATALSALYDPAGTVAIVLDLFRWWLL